MYEFTAAQQKKALFWLVLFPYFYYRRQQLSGAVPFKFSVSLPLGAHFPSPLSSLATDLTVRIFGAPLARRIFFGDVPRPAALYVFSVPS